MLVRQLKKVQQSCLQEELLSFLASIHSCHRNDSLISSRISCGNLDEEVSVALQTVLSCNAQTYTIRIIFNNIQLNLDYLLDTKHARPTETAS